MEVTTICCGWRPEQFFVGWRMQQFIVVRGPNIYFVVEVATVCYGRKLQQFAVVMRWSIHPAYCNSIHSYDWSIAFSTHTNVPFPPDTPFLSGNPQLTYFSYSLCVVHAVCCCAAPQVPKACRALEKGLAFHCSYSNERSSGFLQANSSLA